MPRWPLRKIYHHLQALKPLTLSSSQKPVEGEASSSCHRRKLAATVFLGTFTALKKFCEETSAKKGIKVPCEGISTIPNRTLNEKSPDATTLESFDQMSIKAAEKVITSYSTSFSFATYVLEPELRTDIRNLYAMVRTADEIVDGTARAAGLTPIQTAKLLTHYEREVILAPTQRLHVDPVMHAYAISARRCQFKQEHVRAFFASMRRDITSGECTTDEDYHGYIYGSAEVIGLMCLSAFLVKRPSSRSQDADQRTYSYSQKELDIMGEGARSLGAAFQKVNFLRDWQEDSTHLGRHYFPGAPSLLTDSFKQTIIADIRTDLTAAFQAIPLLPNSAKAGVTAAAELFTELTNILEATSAAEIMKNRASVPPPHKMKIMARALIKARKFHPLANTRLTS
ncbi:Phytoene synthase [Corynebacterium pseudotuberculosis]|uniref:phytoene/squalene synthase family protein n=1 Tax=Corynebacterium pseudotuberculosis TaxID=1719 RepID=UPI0009475ECF|nr:squalene/phytoene synthase family protein [Corynebacterium pseudotuberculosis]APQ55151.1 Phytoene synthase [Corynebacterium pseudotuberculosis]ATV80826.1 Phytoene synthase [Corynebacterium pseudotuberculosis]